MLIVTIKSINAECCYPERPNAEGRDTDCSYTECPLVECRFAESRNKCLYAMCRFVECRGATGKCTFSFNFVLKAKLTYE